ncbi:MAG: hypothetical protein ABFS34_08610 [Gemmatimonadota bacterium]
MYNYDRNLVVAGYRAENPDRLDPKESTLRAYDAGLFAVFDEEARKQAAKKGVPIDRFSLSMLVFFAARSPAVRVDTRVKHGCDYFDSVRPQAPVLEPPAVPPAVADD